MATSFGLRGGRVGAGTIPGADVEIPDEVEGGRLAFSMAAVEERRIRLASTFPLLIQKLIIKLVKATATAQSTLFQLTLEISLQIL